MPIIVPSGIATASKTGLKPLYGQAASGPYADHLIGAWFYDGYSDRFMDLSPFQNHLYPTGTLTDFSTTFDPTEGYVKTCLPTALRSGRFELKNSADNPSGHRLNLHDGIATIMFRARFRDNTSSGGDVTCIIGRNSGISGQNGWLLATNTSNQLYFIVNSGTAVTWSIPGTHLGAWRTYAIVWDVATATRATSLYVDEAEANKGGGLKLVSTSSTSTGTPPSNNLRFALMNSSEANRSFEGDLSWACVWDRKLSLRELNAVNMSPYSAFLPYSGKLIAPWLVPSGGSPPDTHAYVNYRGRIVLSE